MRFEHDHQSGSAVDMRSHAARAIRLVAGLAGLARLVLPCDAQTVTILHHFGNGATNGSQVFAGLVQGTDGNFYGTTEFGGSGGVGTVFRISPSGAYTNLYSFATYFGDGWQPLAGLVQGSDGNFYGTTSAKGTNSCRCGNLFRISPSGSYSNLHYFSGLTNDGSTPRGVLVQGRDGSFYGTATGGGAGLGAAGVVFRISPGGNYTNLYSFPGYTHDGYLPIGNLAQGSDGNFYGVTVNGGSNSFGTVFRISPSGSYTNLHSFAGGYYYGNSDGQRPNAGLVQGDDGNFYGTTTGGGTNVNAAGTVFRMTPSGVCTTLYSFGGAPDGSTPAAALVQGSDGNFYGTTDSGGTNICGCGTIFRISPSGQYRSLYSFGVPGQGDPVAALVQGSDGAFYGTTEMGGTNGAGTVFKMVASLPSPANKISGVSVAGGDVVITVPSVAGETYQLQYATGLTSGNWSNVPGAPVTNSLGGTLTVTNAGGTGAAARYYRLVITP
jgi:uncharacterized repeat protein (TIGR03803 family)